MFAWILNTTILSEDGEIAENDNQMRIQVFRSEEAAVAAAEVVEPPTGSSICVTRISRLNMKTLELTSREPEYSWFEHDESEDDEFVDERLVRSSNPPHSDIMYKSKHACH